MKILAALMILLTLNTHQVYAQKNTTAASPVLAHYYELKNALINSDAIIASVSAGDFMNAVNSNEFRSLKGNNTVPVLNLHNKLMGDAGHIVNTRSISEQREYFASLSQNLLALIKSVKISDQMVYQMYCPMKRQSWLSGESAIRNPYYGKSMLTCGSLTETIKL